MSFSFWTELSRVVLFTIKYIMKLSDFAQIVDKMIYSVGKKKGAFFKASIQRMKMQTSISIRLCLIIVSGNSLWKC